MKPLGEYLLNKLPNYMRAETAFLLQSLLHIQLTQSAFPSDYF